MTNKKIAYVYEIIEGFNPTYNIKIIDFDNDYDGLILKEYLQVDENKVETGRTFSINILLNKLEEQDKKQVQGSLSHNEKDGSFHYHFQHLKIANLHPENETVATEDLSLIISKQISEKYIADARMQKLEETLDRIIHTANISTLDAQESKIRKNRRYKMQRINSFRKATGVLAAIAGAAVITSLVSKGANFVKEQQDLQWQKEQEMMHESTISELQMIDDYSELDQWDSYLQKQREENERMKKLP